MTLKSNIILGSGGHSRVILENLYILKKKNIKIYDFNFSYRKDNTILKNKVIDFKKIPKKEISKNNNLFLAIRDNNIKKYFDKFRTRIKMPNLISKIQVFLVTQN